MSMFLKNTRTAVCKQICRHFARGKENAKAKYDDSGKSRAIDLVDHLDIAKSDDPSKPQNTSGGKLRKGLQAKEKPILDMASQGSLDATGEDIRDIMNEFIESAKFSYAFKGIKNASSLITISKVECNRDISHTTALWKSSQMELFVKMVDSKHGEIESAKMANKICQNIDKTLRAKEGAFRSFMMRKMDFKRVPRVSFHPEDPSLGLKPSEDSTNRSSRYKLRALLNDENEEFAESGPDLENEEDSEIDDEQEENQPSKPYRK